MMAGLTFPALIATSFYVLVMLAAAAAAMTGHRAGQGNRAEVRCWVLVLAFFAVFAALRLGDVENTLRDSLREAMRAENAYAERRDHQRRLLAGLVAVVSAALFAMAFNLSRRTGNPRALISMLALYGCFAMVALIAMRAISYHSLDTLLFGPLKLAWVGDVAISLSVAAAAVLYIRWLRASLSRSRPDQDERRR